MNVSIFSKTDYENKSNWTPGENKPNSNPIKANFKRGTNSLTGQSGFITMVSGKIRDNPLRR